MQTKSGFKYEIDPRILSDWRFVTVVAKSESGTSVERLSCVDEILTLLLGDEQREKFMEHIAKKNDGFIPAETVAGEVKEMLTAAQDIKN